MLNIKTVGQIADALRAGVNPPGEYTHEGEIATLAALRAIADMEQRLGRGALVVSAGVECPECPECKGIGGYEDSLGRWQACENAAHGRGGTCIVFLEMAFAAGRAYWRNTRTLRVTNGNDVEWEDLSSARQIMLMEGGLEVVAAALVVPVS